MAATLGSRSGCRQSSRPNLLLQRPN